ncbi:MAG: glycoside hydrolase family 13 protein [Anaerolineales bacterium]|nr:glycoside hydrolase family 13 protein [Anaerolineales bacterium]MCB8959552.1 glycoside hydrolase family 13 protein [Ardenticatenales bacterium]
MSMDTPAWVRDAVFYQIFPDRFARSDQVAKPAHLQPWGAEPTFHGFQGGDLLGIAEKMSYLTDLGINALFLNPIFASASNHRYHTHDYFTVDPILGGNAAFHKFLKAAHDHNIRVIIDGVFNHASRGFFQFNHLLEAGQESPYRDWFHVWDWPVNAYQEDHPANFAAWWGMHALPKFNTENDAVREFLWSVGTYWLEQGIDGWRLDVPNEINDDVFWQEFRRRCRAINPDCYIVGEFWGEAHRWLQGDQFDAQMNYMMSRALLGFVGGERINQGEISRCGLQYIPALDGPALRRELNRINNELYDYETTLAQLTMLGSHDTPRALTMLCHDRQALKLALFMQMMMPGAPNIYYGDEIGLSGGHDPHSRGAFPWGNEVAWDKAMRADVKQYIQLRHELPALRRGAFRVARADKQHIIFNREYEGQIVVVAVNAGWEPVNVMPWSDRRRRNLKELLAPAGSNLLPGQTVTLTARSARLWTNSGWSF